MSRFRPLILAALLLVLASHGGLAQGLTRNGRWLSYNGSKPYFVGIDMQQLAADPSVNYAAKLDRLQQDGINKVRIWINNYFGSTLLQPWAEQSGKFNLDSWNGTYWSRVRSFVAAAQARDILVEVSIFAANNLRMAADFADCTDQPNAWNRNCNVNNVFQANSGGNFIPEFFDLNVGQLSSSGKRLRDYQQALLDKTVLELGGFGNVYFEVANEFPFNNVNSFCPATPSGCGTYNVYKPGVACADDVDQVNWHVNWLNRLNATTPRLVTAHAQQGWGPNTTGVCHYWNLPATDVLNFHFYTYNPQQISNLLHAAQTHGKVLQNNESGNYLENLNRETRLAWAMLMSGGYFGLYVADPDQIGGTGWSDAAARLRSLRNIAEASIFSQLSPIDAGGNEVDGKITQGPTGTNRQLLAGEATQKYLAYFWCTDNCATTTPVKINVATDRVFDYLWYDVRNGAVIGSGTVSTEAGQPYPPQIPSPGPAQYNANAGLALSISARTTEPPEPCLICPCLICPPPLP